MKKKLNQSGGRQSLGPRYGFGLLLVIVAIWTVGVGWQTNSGGIFGSPDEAANAAFTHEWAASGSLSIPSALTPEQLGLFHPRSIITNGSTLRPASFVFFPILLGSIGKLIGISTIAWVTPVLSGIGLAMLWVLLRSFWGTVWASLGTGLLAIHPAWLTFQSLPFYHNGLFVSLLICAGFALFRYWRRRTLIRAGLLGLVTGLSLAIRPSEILWVGPLVTIVMLAEPRYWRHWLLSTAVVGVVQIPWLLMNLELYGSIWATGYTPEGIISSGGQAAGSSVSFFRILHPPGGWSWHFLSSAWWYLILLVPAWSMMTAIELGRYFKRKLVSRHKWIKLGLVSLLVLFLIVYYGSWDLYPTRTAADIGPLASYVRYWLPLYAAMTAGVVLFLRRIWQSNRTAAVITIIILMASELVVSLGHPTAGLLPRQRQAQVERGIQTEILKQTEPNALVIAGRYDRLLFPERMVGFELPDDQSGLEVLHSVVHDRPVYLLNTLNQYRQSQVVEQLATVGLTISRKIRVETIEVWQISKQ